VEINNIPMFLVPFRVLELLAMRFTSWPHGLMAQNKQRRKKMAFLVSQLKKLMRLAQLRGLI
jgi:hypothetical protein